MEQKWPEISIFTSGMVLANMHHLRVFLTVIVNGIVKSVKRGTGVELSPIWQADLRVD
jgi:hypothetical protein